MAKRHQPQHKTTAPHFRARGQRFIHQAVWESHRQAIVYFFKQELSLPNIIQRMRTEFSFEASPKQYKVQLARWQLRRNMKISDAAHILRLIVEAEGQGCARTVFFFEKEKTRTDITTYLKKTTLVSGENELLRNVDPADDRPWYITFEDRPPATDQTGDVSRIPALTEPTTNMCNPISGSARSSASSFETLQPDSEPYVVLSHNWQSDSSPIQQVTLPVDDSIHFEDARQPFHLSEAPFTISGDPILESECHDPFAQTFRPMENFFGEDEFPVNTSTFSSLMSATPIALTDVNTQEGNLATEAVPDVVGLMLGSDQEYGNAKEQSYSRSFLRSCCAACIYFGQTQYMAGEHALVRAGEIFDLLLQNELEESLTTLNNLLALFDSYGQKALAMRIFDLARKAAEQRLGGADSVTLTIDFMMSIPEQGAGSQPNYDIQRLRDIHERLARAPGANTQLALTAHFNLAWALTEMKQYDEAREILMHLQAPCEKTFGPCQLQTIGCIATLARIHLSTGQEVSAERMMRETVAPRLEESFQSSHPYFWEAKNRHALFLIRLAKSEQHLQKRKHYESKAEIILRQVLHSRVQILGRNNPRTTVTFRALRRLLLRQKREQEAENLHQWCTNAHQRSNVIT